MNTEKEKIDLVLRIAQKFVKADEATKQFIVGYLTRAEEELKKDGQTKKETPVAQEESMEGLQDQSNFGNKKVIGIRWGDLPTSPTRATAARSVLKFL